MSKTVPAKYRLAANLRRIAWENEWTQHEMADECGMRQPNIARVMNADLAVTLETLDRFADGLKVDVRELLDPEAAFESEWNINDIRQKRAERREEILQEAMDREQRRKERARQKAAFDAAAKRIKRRKAK